MIKTLKVNGDEILFSFLKKLIIFQKTQFFNKTFKWT